MERWLNDPVRKKSGDTSTLSWMAGRADKASAGLICCPATLTSS